MGVFKKILIVSCAVLSVVSGSFATPILGGSLFVSETGTVDATFLGHTAGYTNDLYLYVWDAGISSYTIDNSVGLIFTNHTTPVGTTIELAGEFTAGQELVFGIYVRNTGDTFFTGDASRNPDGIAHAIVDEDFSIGGVQATYVGFEDLFNGGDRDFDDLMFAFTNTSTSVPEPSVISLLGLGLVGLFFRKKNK